MSPPSGGKSWNATGMPANPETNPGRTCSRTVPVGPECAPACRANSAAPSQGCEDAVRALLRHLVHGDAGDALDDLGHARGPRARPDEERAADQERRSRDQHDRAALQQPEPDGVTGHRGRGRDKGIE